MSTASVACSLWMRPSRFLYDEIRVWVEISLFASDLRLASELGVTLAFDEARTQGFILNYFKTAYRTPSNVFESLDDWEGYRNTLDFILA